MMAVKRHNHHHRKSHHKHRRVCPTSAIASLKTTSFVSLSKRPSITAVSSSGPSIEPSKSSIPSIKQSSTCPLYPLPSIPVPGFTLEGFNCDYFGVLVGHDESLPSDFEAAVLKCAQNCADLHFPPVLLQDPCQHFLLNGVTSPFECLLYSLF